MARSLCPDRERATVAIVAALGVLAWPGAGGQVLVIALAGLVGWRLLGGDAAPAGPAARVAHGRGLSVASLALFAALLVAAPLARQLAPSQPLAVFDSFYRAGALVFGGGHVVLPLLYAEVVPPGWVSAEQFVAGYGAAQAVPGPLFTFAAYLGAAMHVPPSGWRGAALALGAVFLPSFLLVVGALPFWNALRARHDVQGAVRGINAAVVGLLLAALYAPVWTSAIHAPRDVGLALAAFALLAFWKVPPWLVVALSAAGATALAAAR